MIEGIMAHAMTYYAAIGAIAPERHELFPRSARCPITACSAFGVRVLLWPATAQMGPSKWGDCEPLGDWRGEPALSRRVIFLGPAPNRR